VPVFLETNAAAAALVGVSAVTYAGLEWRLAARRRRGPQRRALAGGNADRGTKHIVMAGMFTGFALGWPAAALLPSLAFPGNGWIYVAIGLAVFWAGVALRLRSIAVLGRFFRLDVVIQEGHRLVRSGPYRRLRHPAYTGSLMIAAGYGITLANWASLAALIVLPLAGLVARIRVEEAALERSLGDSYRSYMRETRRLIPGLW
jgi:protein-S-isoprenylcysteine O-methyltransferase Ste14